MSTIPVMASAITPGAKAADEVVRQHWSPADGHIDLVRLARLVGAEVREAELDPQLMSLVDTPEDGGQTTIYVQQKMAVDKKRFAIAAALGELERSRPTSCSHDGDSPVEDRSFANDFATRLLWAAPGPHSR